MAADDDRKHVLFVDDEPTMHRIVARTLRDQDVRLTCAADGAEALRVLERGRVDLLVTTLTLPVVDGVDLLRHVANRGLTVPVIVATAGVPPPPAPRSPLRFVREPLRPADLAVLVHEQLTAAAGGPIALAELAQILAVDRRSCTLRAAADDLEGVLLFHRGSLVDAAVDGLAGDAAARRLLSWRRATLRVEPLDRTRRPSITADLATLLPALPRPTASPAPPHAPAPARFEPATPAANAPVSRRHSSSHPAPPTRPASAAPAPTPEPAAPAPTPEPAASASPVSPAPGASPPEPALAPWERPEAAARIAALLDDVMQIDGAIGAGLAVWELDECLDIRTAPAALAAGPMRTTLSGHARMMRAVQATMARLRLSAAVHDVLITLDEQLHVLATLPHHDGLLVDLVLDRPRSTLALARIRLAALLARFDLGPA